MKTYLIDADTKSNDNKIINDIKRRKRRGIFDYNMIKH